MPMAKPKASFAAYTIRRIPRQLWHDARVIALKRNTTMRELLLDLLRREVAKHG